jgi:hypothetical protein
MAGYQACFQPAESGFCCSFQRLSSAWMFCFEALVALPSLSFPHRRPAHLLESFRFLSQVKQRFGGLAVFPA